VPLAGFVLFPADPLAAFELLFAVVLAADMSTGFGI
jgi:hypothetical protein